MSKRKHVFLDENSSQLDGVKRSLKSENFNHCSLCRGDINLVSIRNFDTSAHNATETPQNSGRIFQSNQPMKKYF